MSKADDEIEKVVELAASPPRVWRALTDHKEFGEWFRVELDGPFEPGKVSTGKMTFPGAEGLPWRAIIDRMEPERLFSFRWHDYDPNADKEISQQPTTMVTFRLEPIPTGTRLTIIESGFSALPPSRRIDVMRGNQEGWEIQSGNLAEYLSA